MRTRIGKRLVTQQHYDDEARPYIQQLMNNQNYSQVQTNDGQSSQLLSSANAEVDQDDDAGHSEPVKVRGPTLLKDIWSLPPGKTIVVRFNNRNQAVGKESRKLASFLGIIARTPELTPLNIDDWRNFDNDDKKKLLQFVRKKFSFPTRGDAFVKRSLGKKWKDYKCDLNSIYMKKYKTKGVLLKNKPSRIPRDQWIGLVSYWVSDKAKKRSQSNRRNRAKQKMPYTGGSKSIATLMDEKTVDGREPTRAESFILTHAPRKDGRPIDEESANAIDMMNEKFSNGKEISNEQPPESVAWKGDVYSQVMGNERSGYVRGLGLGPTPSLLWGSTSSLGNTDGDGLFNEVVQRLEQEVKELKGLKKKQDEEMDMMKQNQARLLSELSWVGQVIGRSAPPELSMPQNFNRSYWGVPL